MASHPVHPAVGHVVSLRLLFGVLAILLALTVATVGVTTFDFGPANLIVALAIATVKGALVLLYFMHLRWDRPFNGLILVGALVFVAIFVGLTLLDSMQYQPTVIPGYAPEMPR